MNIAVILAAGKSERLNDISVPKQLYLLNNVPLFMYSVLTFSNLEDRPRGEGRTSPRHP